ncbi:MAG: methyltransferase domain-containing protein [Candidatus Sumerlaeota bacterium]|nr:methyltransferase domain-containing protein [Candidatus Sumerlaeota bacterium]
METRLSDNPDAQWRQNLSVFEAGACPGWQRLANDLHAALLDRWNARLPRGALVLKTDLFEEALSTDPPWRAIESRGWRPVGMDIGRPIAARARERLSTAAGEPPIAQADARRLAFQDECLDAIFSNSTLDHFRTDPEIDGALAEFHRVLKPGGRLLLTLDNPTNPIIGLRNALPRRLTDRLRLTRFFVGRTLRAREAEARLRQIGFDALEGGTLMHAPRALAIPLLRWARAAGLSRLEAALVRVCRSAEALGTLPTARWTGHFLWIEARKPS